VGDYSVSREQFDPDNFVSRKIFQHGTRIVDSDMNEQVLIDLHRQRRISYGLMGRIDQRIGVGFAFKSGGVNEVSLNKGDAFVEMTDDGIGGTHHIYKEDDTIITGFTTPSSGDRTDYVYLDIYFEIIDSDDDTGLINPDVAAESAVDIRAKMDWLKIEGASIPSAPAGHTYVGLLQIDRLDGNANITEAMCTNLLEKFDDWLEEDGTVSLKGNMAVDAGITIDGTDLSETLLQDGSRNLEGNMAVDAGITVDGVDISQLKTDFDTLDSNALLKDGSVALEGNMAVNADVTIDGADVGSIREVIWTMKEVCAHDTLGACDADYILRETSTSYVRKARFHYFYHDNSIKVLRFRFFFSNGDFNFSGYAKLDVVGLGSDEVTVNESTGYQIKELEINIAGHFSIDDEIDIDLWMKQHASSSGQSRIKWGVLTAER
jgi:hypothetical protein